MSGDFMIKDMVLSVVVFGGTEALRNPAKIKWPHSRDYEVVSYPLLKFYKQMEVPAPSPHTPPQQHEGSMKGFVMAKTTHKPLKYVSSAQILA